ncbi:MAG: T9SS type A sorting domain-containing protein, partial [candidate division WOR-3 bacterium]
RVIKRINVGCSLDAPLTEYDGRANRLYLDCAGGLLIFDCRSDSLLAQLPDEQYRCMALNSFDRELYGASGKRVAVVKDSTTAVRERKAVACLSPPTATAVRGALHLPLTGRQDVALLDVTGRRVMSLQPGENDIRHVAPGVYFVHQKGPRGQGFEGPSVRKIVIQR